MPKHKHGVTTQVVSIKRDAPISENQPKASAHDPEGHRMIIAIGSQRIAFDFKTEITHLDPETGVRPAPVVPFCKPKGRRNRPKTR